MDPLNDEITALTKKIEELKKLNLFHIANGEAIISRLKGEINDLEKQKTGLLEVTSNIDDLKKQQETEKNRLAEMQLSYKTKEEEYLQREIKIRERELELETAEKRRILLDVFYEEYKDFQDLNKRFEVLSKEG